MRKHPILSAGAAILAFGAAAVVTAAAEEAPQKHPSASVPAEKYYKNIQVLQGTPSTEIMPIMNFMKASLGVQCSYCHVTNDTGRWPVELDDKAAKGRAREMIKMTRAINDGTFKGRIEVTCATCHRGSTDPVALPPLLSASAPAHPPSGLSGSETLPSVETVLDKYVAAVGGRDAMARVKNRKVTGTFTGGDGKPHPIEVDLSSSGGYRSSVTVDQGAFTMVFDGKAGTTGGPSWNNPMMPDEADRIHDRARLFPAADVKSIFPALAVRGKDTIDGRDAWMLVGRNPTPGGTRETYWFDTQNGLLLRTLRRQPTPLGDNPEQTDYSDYRDVDGVKVPFVVKHTAPDRTDTITATEIKQNVELPDSTFTPRPA